MVNSQKHLFDLVLSAFSNSYADQGVWLSSTGFS